MVGRFESPELSKDALAYEDWCANPGAGCGLSFLACIVVSVGVYASQPRLGSVTSAPMRVSTPLSSVSSTGSEFAGYEELGRRSSVYDELRRGSSGLGDSDGDLSHDRLGLGHEAASTPREEVRQVGLDFGLIALCVTFFGCFVVHPAWRAATGPRSPWTTAPNPWMAQGTQAGQAMQSFGGLGPDMLCGGARGRLVDVKPGDLRGAGAGGGLFGGGFFGGSSGVGWAQGPGAMDLLQAPLASGSPFGGSSFGSSSFGQPLGAQPPFTTNNGIFGGGAWGQPSNSAPSWQRGSQTGVFSSLGNLGSSLGSAFGLGGGSFGSQQGASSSALPSETEVAETYAAFGVELQAWAPALIAVVDRDLVQMLMRELDQSDQQWKQALAPRGWRLTTEAPQFSPGAPEISVFDRHLPKPWSDDPGAAQLWAHRQMLESYLIHPSFEPAQRQFVLERLQEWRTRGIATALRADYRPNDLVPTDAHILENMIVKMLNSNLDFANCFMASGHSPPLGKHLGLPASAYLRQVTDQTAIPRPAPHYEVVTMQRKTWKIRPGNTSILEALALLLQALGRHSRSYQAFPQVFRSALEQAPSVQAATGPPRLFSWSGPGF